MLKILVKLVGVIFLVLAFFPLAMTLLIANQEYLHLYEVNFTIHDISFAGRQLTVSGSLFFTGTIALALATIGLLLLCLPKQKES